MSVFFIKRNCLLILLMLFKCSLCILNCWCTCFCLRCKSAVQFFFFVFVGLKVISFHWQFSARISKQVMYIQAWHWIGMSSIGSISLLTRGLLWPSTCLLEVWGRNGVFLLLPKLLFPEDLHINKGDFGN